VNAPGRISAGWLVVLTFVLAGCVRFFALGNQSLWLDEVLTVLETRQLDEEGWKSGLLGRRGPLYSYVMTLIPDGKRTEWWVRFPSALWGLALIPVSYALGRGLVNGRAGLFAAVSAAFSPFAVWYSQEARYVCLFMLLSAISNLYAHRFALSTDVRSGTAYVLSTLLMLFSFVGGIFLLAGQAVGFLAFRQAKRSLLRWLLVLGVVIIIFAPWLCAAYGILGFDGQEAEGSGFSIQKLETGYWRAPDLRHVGYALYAFGVGYSWGPSVRELHEDLSSKTVLLELPAVAVAFALMGAIVLAGVSSLWSRSRSTLVWMLACGAAPLLGPLVLALQSGVSYNVRYTAGAFPLFIVILGAGMAWWWERRWVGKVMVAAVLALWFASLANLYWNPRYAKDDNRAAAQLVESVRGTDETVVVGEETRAYGFYARQPFVSWRRIRVSRDEQPLGNGERLPGNRFWVVSNRPWQDVRFIQLVEELRECLPLEPSYRVPGYEIFALRTSPLAGDKACQVLATR